MSDNVSVSFGIDLGTTNSCISMMKAHSSIPTIIPLDYGNTLQSCVMLNSDGTLTVGKEAYEHRYEKSTIYSVKRFMGTNKKIELVNGEHRLVLTPEEVSAEILKELVKQAEKYTGSGVIKDVTITVPAHFNDAQRRATRSAGELAGLNVINIINEPTSAGLLYGLDNAKSNQTILVYDLGGGTFDVSILRITKELQSFPLLGINMNGEYNKTSINIVGNDGDTALGGDDIDRNVTDYVISNVALQAEVTENKVKEIIGTIGYEELKLRLEKAKKSFNKSINVPLRGYGDFTVELTGSQFEEECYRPIFNRTYDLISQAMSNSGITAIDNIVLVGGSTKSQIIQRMLKEKFSHLNILNTFEPDLSVGLGASVSSATTLGISKIATITDVVPMSIGILSVDNSGHQEFTKILKKDSQLPCSVEKEFSVINDDMDINLTICQGESTRNIDALTNIGHLTIKSDRYKGHDLTVGFKCDLNGVLSCYVIIDRKEIPVDITYSANIMSAEKSDDCSMLDKGQKFFYDSHKRKLREAGLTNEELKEWKPSYVLSGIPEAKKKYKELLEKYKK